MTVHMLIQGKVQGVFYRASAKDVAQQLDITGWIRNTPDGDVECMATGAEQNIKEFIEWCHKGPRRAVVDKVVIRDEEEKEFDEFKITK